MGIIFVALRFLPQLLFVCAGGSALGTLFQISSVQKRIVSQRSLNRDRVDAEADEELLWASNQVLDELAEEERIKEELAEAKRLAEIEEEFKN